MLQNDILMSLETRTRLAAVAADLSADEKAAFDAGLRQAGEAAAAISGHWDFMAPAHAVDRFLSAQPAWASAEGRLRLRRAAIARFALEQFEPTDALPASILELYPAFFARLADYLTRPYEGDYDPDHLAKDVRYALGLTVPGGTLTIDLRYRIGPKLMLRGLRDGSAAMRAYLAAQGWGNWYNDHMDARDTEHPFNPEGWTDSFRRFADMLEANPRARGITGVSWFYDPAVTEVSPRMAYVRRTQCENGAFVVRIETGATHTANATATSPTRRKLVEEGKYVPTCYLIAWPREPLIKWARKLEREPSLAFS